MLFFFIGTITLLFHTESLQRTNYIHFEKAFEKSQFVTLTLNEKLKSNDYNDRYIAVFNQIGKKSCSGKIILNIQKDKTPNLLIIGNIIRLKTILQHNSTPKNPNQFDYSQYLKDKQIYAQIYAVKSEISVNRIIKKDIWYYTAKLHCRIIHNLEKVILIRMK